MISAIQTALSGLLAASKKVETGASNIANINTTGSLEDPDNAPYTPVTTVQKALADESGQGLGVKADVVAKNNPFTPVYSPDSPFANEEGIIGAPNVDLAEEAVNLKIAGFAYKASLSVIKTASAMEDELLRSFDKKA